MGEYEKAAEEWEETLVIRPEDTKARNNYCDALLQLKKYDQGLEEIEKVLVQEPDYPPALCTKAELLEKLGESASAKELYISTIEKIKDNPEWEILYKYISKKLS